MLGYYGRSKGYRVYNTEIQIVEESIHVKFDDKIDSEKSKLVDKFVDLEIVYLDSEHKASEEAKKEAKSSEQKVTDTPVPLKKFN